MSPIDEENLQAKRAWNTNAGFWDQGMGEGNDFFNILIWPAVERFLEPASGQNILDVACGNGVTSRRLAKAGVTVTAIDFAESMVELAKQRGGPKTIDYRVLDVTDYGALISLGLEVFDSVLCNMALMDIASIEPLFRAVAQLLRPAGPFVFSILHPCFNNPATVLMGEREDREGNLVDSYSVKVSRYKSSFTRLGVAMRGQPEPHIYFHRSLETLLALAFRSGLLLDGFLEPSFSLDYGAAVAPLGWGHFTDIPPALVARLRRGV